MAGPGHIKLNGIVCTANGFLTECCALLIYAVNFDCYVISIVHYLWRHKAGSHGLISSKFKLCFFVALISNFSNVENKQIQLNFATFDRNFILGIRNSKIPIWCWWTICVMIFTSVLFVSIIADLYLDYNRIINK